jgi:UDP:flavonoid glycosyltransferase YjiC (YdhE family)
MGRDQHDNAARVALRGAGLTLPQDASVETIGAAVRRLLDEPDFGTAAKALGAAISADEATRSAPEALEALVRP